MKVVWAAVVVGRHMVFAFEFGSKSRLLPAKHRAWGSAVLSFLRLAFFMLQRASGVASTRAFSATLLKELHLLLLCLGLAQEGVRECGHPAREKPDGLGRHVHLLGQHRPALERGASPVGSCGCLA